MPDRTCAQCGQPFPPDGRFCSRCGAILTQSGPERVDPATMSSSTLFDPAMAPSMAKTSQATMFGFAGNPVATAPSDAPTPGTSAPPVATPIVPAPVVDTAPRASSVVAPPAAPAPASVRAPALASSKMTMIGVAAVSVPAPAAAPSTPAPKPGYVPSGKGTMLGVAIPGIAPLAASSSAPPAAAAPGGGRSTMLGVAIPGIAPVHSTAPVQSGRTQALAPARPAPVVLPKPAPLVDDEPVIGPAPRLARRGVPLTYVAGGVFALVLVFGGVVALLWKGQSLIVVPRQDAQGHERLHLECDSCQDGTTATLDGASATFNAKEADLVMAAPLKVGDNPLRIHLERPRMGRNEDVQVVVPIAFRIKADLAALSGAHPTVTVRVQAVEGTVVTVADKPVPLDAHGDGAYAIDVSSQTTGWSDDLRLIDQGIAYGIVTPARDGRPSTEQHGSLAVRAGIATLHLEAPGVSAVIDGSSFRVAGHTVKGGTVTINGQPITMEPDGSFSHSYDAPTVGEVPIELRADGPQLASRTAHFTVKRVAHLASEAKARERAAWVGYNGITSADSVGKVTVVEGDVAQARATANQLVAIVDDARDCTPGAGPCLVRVVYSGAEPVAAGDHVRVYGRVSGVLAANTSSAAGAKAVPVVDADFLVKGKAGGR